MDQQQAHELARILHMSGGLMGGLVGCFGGLAGYLAPRGKGRVLVLGGLYAFIGLGVASLAAGGALAVAGVPWVVCYPLVLMGFILTVVVGCLTPVMRKRYREAEARRMEAAALRHT